MSKDLRARAEEIQQKNECILINHDQEAERERIYKALQETREEALKEAAEICLNFTTVPNCNQKEHDERWCARCDAMDDAADMLNRKILSLIDGKEK